MLNAVEQMKIIKKGALEIIDEGELLQKLIRSEATGKPLVVKLGLDPSAPDIHLGHAVVLRKIKQLQDLGHVAVIIIGDFTGRIGDPTGKSKTRNQLTQEAVLINAETYKTQIFRVLDPAKTTVKFNSKWLGALNLTQVMDLLSKHTLARILERDDFKTRFEGAQPIGLHELLYPLLQGYDSLAIEADIELGGTDQRFNILMGRDMQNKAHKEKQIALFMPLLEGLDGIEKMSKSLGNYVGIHEAPQTQYEKVMTLPDTLITKYFTLCTDMHPDEIEIIEHNLLSGNVHPKTIKMQLAKEIVRLYHSEMEANEAEAHFIRVFSKNELPSHIPAITCATGDCLIDLIVMGKMVQSKSDARRLIQQAGVKINDQLITDIFFNTFHDGDVIRVGKKKFLRILCLSV